MMTVQISIVKFSIRVRYYRYKVQEHYRAILNPIEQTSRTICEYDHDSPTENQILIPI